MAIGGTVWLVFGNGKKVKGARSEIWNGYLKYVSLQKTITNFFWNIMMPKTGVTKKKVAKKKPARKKRAKSKKIAKPANALIIIDNQSIRQKAVQKAKRAMRELEKSNQVIDTFNEVDYPAYQKWYHSTFGAKLTELRELDGNIIESTQKINLIKYLSYREEISEYEAYVLYEKEYAQNSEKLEKLESDLHKEINRVRNPFEEDFFEEDFFEEEEDWQFNQEDDEEQNDAEMLQPDELEELFQQVARMMGIAIDANSQTYQEEFEQFQKSYYADFQKKGVETPVEIMEESDTEQDRIKERYRNLARILHPDLRHNETEKEKIKNDKLWNDSQQAYEDGDLQALDSIMAICDIYSRDKKRNKNTSIADILDIAKRYRKDTKILKQQIKNLKKDIAWGFSKLKNKNKIKKQIQKEIKLEEKRLKYQMKDIEDFYEWIGKPPEPSLAKTKNKQTSHKKPTKKKVQKPKKKFQQEETLFDFV